MKEMGKKGDLKMIIIEIIVAAAIALLVILIVVKVVKKTDAGVTGCNSDEIWERGCNPSSCPEGWNREYTKECSGDNQVCCRRSK